MRQKVFLWIEDYLFFPNFIQKIVSFFLLPLTFIYLLIILLKRAFASKLDFGLPIISIGNIVVGGSGKTPMSIALASKYESFGSICVILRGYGRTSKGLIIVSLSGKIQTDVEISGDEAMLLAQSLKNATIIVSEDRVKAILKAKELGCKIIFLDDGFSKYKINKFDILLRPKIDPTNIFCLPSGGYREPKSFYALCDLELQEGIDFKRVVNIKKDGILSKLPEKTLLLTAISKPKRLLEFLPANIAMLAFEDHHTFTEDEISEILEKYKDYSFVTTAKDLVKLKDFNIPNIYLMDLDIEIDNSVDFKKLDDYLENFKKGF